MAASERPRPYGKERGPNSNERDISHGTALAVLVDPGTEAAYRVQLARECYGNGYADGWQDGAVAAIAAYKSAQHGIYRAAQLDQRRYHVCCGPCRRRGHRNGCAQCSERERETYGRPHRDDFAGRGAA